MFRQMDLKGKVKKDTQLSTVHQNTISTIRIYEDSGGRVSKLSSECEHPTAFVAANSVLAASGVDGRVVVWSL